MMSVTFIGDSSYNTGKSGNMTTFLGVSPDGKGWLDDVNGQLVLHLSGTGYEMGYQHGFLLKDEVKRSINAWVYDGKESTGNPPSSLMDFYKSVEPYIPQRFKDEMKGIADGADVPLVDVQAANVKPDFKYFSCRQIACWENATADGNLYYARSLGFPLDNRDHNSGVALQDQSLVMVVKPDGYYPFVNFGWPSVVGSLTGMNSKGIALGINDCKTNDINQKGIPRPLKLRMVLEEASSLSEGLNILRDNNIVGWLMTLCDGNIPEAYGVEITGSLFYAGPWDDPVEYYNDPSWTMKYEPLEDTIMRFAHRPRNATIANTMFDDDGTPIGLKPNDERYQSHADVLKENYGKIDLNILENMMKNNDLNDPVGEELHQVFLCPSTLDIRVTNAVGSTSSKYLGSYHFNLWELLNETPLVSKPKNMPDVSIERPLGGSSILRIQHKIIIRGRTDSDNKVDKVYVKVDDNDYVLAEGTESWSKTVDSSNWEPKSCHRIKALVVDENGYGDIDIIGVWKFGVLDYLDYLVEQFLDRLGISLPNF